MKSYIMRIEAVNLGYSVYDTNDISTIRGGSYLLQDAISAAAASNKSVEVISSAASIGLFKIKAASVNEASQIAQDVDASVSKHARFGTFVYAIREESPNEKFSETLHRLTLACRTRQYQSWSFKLPEKAMAEYCAFDGVRPALAEKNAKDKYISEPVEFRQGKGRELRRKLYSRLLTDKQTFDVDKLEFTSDLEALSKKPDEGVMSGKIAFIYIDGNRFGSIRDEVSKSEADYKAYQNHVQELLRKTALNAVIEYANDNRSSFATDSGDLRLETLLWGGDEIEWVVPSWEALNVLDVFYDSIKAYEEFRDIALTHSAGVVFCNHKLPILNVRDYAHKLCDVAKGIVPKVIKELNNSHNCFAVLDLSSFDLISGDFSKFVTDYYTPADKSDFILRPEDISLFKQYLPTLYNFFPRNKLHQISRAIRNGEADKASEILERSLKLSGENNERLENAIEKLIQGNTMRWLVLAELFQYSGGLK